MLPNEDEISNIIFRNLSPFADAKWRENYPKDNWKWDEKTIKTLSKMVAKVLSKRINGTKGGG